MKLLLFILLLAPGFLLAQEIATTEDGRRVFLKADGTYEFIKDSDGRNFEKNLKGEIKGVVTFFFNDNYGNKPDIGSDVIIRPTSEEDTTRFIVNQYILAKLALSILEGNKTLGQPLDEKYEKKLKELGIQTPEDFEKFSEKVLQHVTKSQYSQETYKTTVDGNGNFQQEVEPGKYEVIVISKNRTSATLLEVGGKIDSKIVDVKPGEKVNLNYEFKL